MTDKLLILEFLETEYDDEHPVIYLYACGQERSMQTAFNKAFGLCEKIFHPSLSKDLIRRAVMKFLNEKRKAYQKGLIKVKAIYS